MKDKEPIDKLFRQSLEHYEVTPPPALKRAVEDALETEKQKRSSGLGGMRALIAILLLGILSGALLIANNLISVPKSSAIKRNAKSTKYFAVVETSPSIRDIKTKQTDIQSHHVIGVSTEPNLTVRKGIFLDSKKNDSRYQQQLQLNNHTTVVANINMHHVNSSQTSNSPIYGGSTQINIPQPNINSSQTGSKLDAYPSYKETVTDAFATTENSGLSNVSEVSNPKRTEEIKAENLTNNDSAATENLPTHVDKKIPQPNATHSQFFVALTSGTGLNYNSFYQTNSISKRELNDSIGFNKPYFQVQLLAGINFHNLSLTSGIGLMQQYEKIKYAYFDSKVQRIFVDSIYIDPVTFDTIVKHHVPVDTIVKSYRSNQVQTTYTELQLPLMLSYGKVLSKRFKIDVSVGGVMQVLIQSKGNYKTAPNETLSDFQSKEAAPLRHVNFSALAAAGLCYKLNDRTELMLVMPFQFGLSNFYNRSYFIARRVNSIGTQIGCKMSF
ncbi:MAG: hypothetical protein ACK5HE_08870 [Bacteroidota bacterium]|jgi:hypothetical protein